MRLRSTRIARRARIASRSSRDRAARGSPRDSLREPDDDLRGWHLWRAVAARRALGVTPQRHARAVCDRGDARDCQRNRLVLPDCKTDERQLAGLPRIRVPLAGKPPYPLPVDMCWAL